MAQPVPGGVAFKSVRWPSEDSNVVCALQESSAVLSADSAGAGRPGLQWWGSSWSHDHMIDLFWLIIHYRLFIDTGTQAIATGMCQKAVCQTGIVGMPVWLSACMSDCLSVCLTKVPLMKLPQVSLFPIKNSVSFRQKEWRMMVRHIRRRKTERVSPWQQDCDICHTDCNVQVNVSAACWYRRFLIVESKIWIWMEEEWTSSDSKDAWTICVSMVLMLQPWKARNLWKRQIVEEEQICFLIKPNTDVFLLLLTASFCCLGSMNVVSPDQLGKNLRCSVRSTHKLLWLVDLCWCFWCFREREDGFSWTAW